MRTGTSALLSDVLDRATLTTLPDASTTQMQYGIGNDAFGKPRFSTTVTDANGNTKQSYRDVRELITTVVEHNRPFGADGSPAGTAKAPLSTRRGSNRLVCFYAEQDYDVT